MKKIVYIFFLIFILSSKSSAEEYFFKNCTISNAVIGDYVINLKKNIIEVELKSIDGNVQYFSDKIKLVEKNKIISQKIKSARGEDLYYQYFLDSKSKSVTKLQFKKESGADISVFNLMEKRVSNCKDIKANWDKRKIDKEKLDKEQKEILKAQEKIKQEQKALINCQGNNYKQWTNCKGSYKSDKGDKYTGLFKDGKILKGTALYLNGSKFVGEFKNHKPNGYGTFQWINGDKYFGEWKDGKISGNGTRIWKDGRKYMGDFKNEVFHGNGSLFYPDGKRYDGGFLNGKRHGEGTITYSDGSSFIGKFVNGKTEGLGQCISIDGASLPCKSETETQAQDFTGKDIKKISIVAKKWVRISQYESNSKKGKKVMDKLKEDFKNKSIELCKTEGNYKVLEEKIEVLEIDETPAYGLETKLKLGINGAIECK